MSHIHKVTLKLTGSHSRIKKKKKGWRPASIFCCKYCYIWKGNNCHIEMRLLDDNEFYWNTTLT